MYSKFKGLGMPTKKFCVKKLVRDKTHERLAKQGIVSHERILSHEEFKRSLCDKLKEEAEEVVLVIENPREVASEIADVLEVLHAMVALQKIPWQEIEAIRLTKRSERGGFDSRVYSEYIEIDENNPKINYFKSQPDKYPEII
jgi:predicted house-cleaning noncanonical NTP pyrophosphatase (MazG superfamily)